MEINRRHNKSNVSNIGYHVVFIPKYRKKILKWGFKDVIEKSILEKAISLDIKIVVYEIMPDHVHLFIKCKPIHNISNIIGQLKGYSSYCLRKQYPKCKKYKSLWTPGYFCESIGHISEKTIVKYIEDQWKHYEN